MANKYRTKLNQNDPVVELSVPQDVYRELLESAVLHKCSLNTEMLLRLSNSLKHDQEFQDLSRQEWLDFIFTPMASSPKSDK